MAFKATTDLFGAYSKLNAQHAQSAKNLQNIIARGRTATQTQREFNREVRNAQSEFAKLNTRVLAADKAVGRWQRTGERSITLGRDLVGAFGVATGVTLFAALSRDVFQTTAELQSMDLALRQVIGSEEEAAKTQEFLSKIAEDYGVNIQVLTKSYTGFFASSKNAIDSGKISAQQIRDIFQSVAKAAGAMGLSVDQQEGAFLALSQMISKGNVQAEELRGQLSERLPGAFGILAKSMGVTEQELNKLLKDGKVLAAEVLPAFAKELEKAYGVENLERVETLNAATTRLHNTWVAFIRTLNEDGGVLQNILISIVENFGKTIEGLGYLMTSSASKRSAELKTIYQTTYDQTSSLYKKTLAEQGLGEKAREEYIKRESAYARTRAVELANEVKAIKSRNAELAKEGNNTPFGFVQNKDAAKQTKENEKAVKDLNNQISYYNGIINASNDALKKENVTKSEAIGLTDKQRDAIEKLNKALAKLRGQASDSDSDREIADLERRRFLAEETLKNERLYLEQRLELMGKIRDLDLEIAAKEYLNTTKGIAERVEAERLALKLQVIETELSEKEKAAKISEINLQYDKILKNELQIAADKFRTEQEKAERDSDERINDDKKKNFQEFLDYRAKYGRPNEDPERFGDANMLPTDLSEDLVNQWKEVKKGQDGAKDSLKDYFKTFQEEFFGDIGLPTLFKILNDEIDGFGENAYVTALAVSEVFQEAFNAIAQASNQAFEVQLANLEKRKEVEIRFAGESTTARAEIERKYDAERKRIQREQAKQQKEIALFNAIINTAQGITAALAEGSYALAIVIAALGAVQIALIASQPLPEFAKGTKNAPEGLAWTQEKGAELITDKDGRVKTTGSDSGAKLTKLSKGDKVYTALETRKIMAFDSELNGLMHSNGISSPKAQQQSMDFDYDRIGKEMRGAVKDLPILNLNIDKDGFAVSQQRGLAKTNYINNRIAVRGKSV